MTGEATDLGWIATMSAEFDAAEDRYAKYLALRKYLRPDAAGQALAIMLGESDGDIVRDETDEAEAKD